MSAHLELVARLEVARAHPADPLTLMEKRDDIDGGGAECSLSGHRAREQHRETRVVDLCVVVADTASQRVVAQCRRLAQARRPREMAVARHRRVHACQGVVEEQARPHDETVPHGALEGKEEGRGLDEVWRDGLEQKPPLVERLSHQSDVQSLEVPKPSVDQLAGTTRRACGEIAFLDQSDRETAAGGVESDAAPGHAAADDEHVERVVGQAGE